jgi:hypothetical protein
MSPQFLVTYEFNFRSRINSKIYSTQAPSIKKALSNITFREFGKNFTQERDSFEESLFLESRFYLHRELRDNKQNNSMIAECYETLEEFYAKENEVKLNN